MGLFIDDDIVLLIDSQFEELSDKIKTAISGVTDKPISFVINTHWHHDHVGGNKNFELTNSTILAHNNVLKR